MAVISTDYEAPKKYHQKEIKKESGTIEKSNKEEKHHTSYLDKPELALCQHGYLLRLRKEDNAEDEFQINLKYRASDRYIAANRDLSSSQKGKLNHPGFSGDKMI